MNDRNAIDDRLYQREQEAEAIRAPLEAIIAAQESAITDLARLVEELADAAYWAEHRFDDAANVENLRRFRGVKEAAQAVAYRYLKATAQ